MHKKLFITLLFAYFLNISSIWATTNFATIDLEYILKNSLAAKGVLSELNNNKKSYQLEIEQKNKSLEKEYNNLKKQASVLSEEVIKSKEKKLMNNIQKLEQSVQKKQKKLQSDYLKTLAIIEQEIIAIVKKLAQKNSYNMVITKSNLLYYDDNLNISDQVVKILNKKLPKIKLSDFNKK